MDGEAIQDLFAELGPVRTRRMFSGYGVFAGDVCFALALQGELYMKVDAETVGRFERAGSQPFTYSRAGRVVSVAFWRLPDEAADDPSAAAEWGRLALDAARRGKARKPAKAGAVALRAPTRRRKSAARPKLDGLR